MCDQRHREEWGKSRSNSNIRIVATGCNAAAHAGRPSMSALLPLACRAGIRQTGHRIRTNHAERRWIVRWHPERAGEDGIHRDDLDGYLVLDVGVVGRNYEATGWLAGLLGEPNDGAMSRIVRRNDDASIRPWIGRGARKQYNVSDDGPPGPPS